MTSTHRRRGRGTIVALALVAAAACAAGAPAASADDFTATPATVRAGAAVTFAAALTDGPPVVSYGWDFGDGTVAGAEPSVTHAFASPGTKTVTLSITRRDTATESVTHTVEVLAPPQATFTVAPAVASPGHAVQFDASGSTDPAGGDLAYRWDFGDGASGTGAAPSHAYDAPGDFTVTLTVTSALDQSTAASTHAIHVSAPPQGSLAMLILDRPAGQSASTPAVGQSVLLDAQGVTGADGSTLSYAWDLGDGTFTAPGPSPWIVTSFAQAGPRTVRLRITRNDGAEAIATLGVVVDAPPVARFDLAPAAPRTGGRVVLTSTAMDPDGPSDLAAIAWDLNGDGVFDDATGASATAVFVRAGDVTIAQRVTDASGVTATAFRTITVMGPPASTAPVPGAARLVPPAKVLRRVRLRLTGSVTGDLTTLTSVKLLAPSGSRASVRCAGAGCPRKSFSGRVPTSGVLRLTTLRRTFHAGARLTVVVQKRGYLARRIRVTFRRAKPPLRSERCLMPVAGHPTTTRAMPCPAP